MSYLTRLPVETGLTISGDSAALLFFLIMAWIVLGILREIRPMWFYILAATLFVLSQLDYFLLNKVRDICRMFPNNHPRDAFLGDLQRHEC